MRKNWCFWIVVLGKTLESPLDCKEIKPLNPKGNQPWIFTGRTDAETEAPILWSPDAKSRLTGKDSDTGKDWGQADKGMTEDGIIHSVDWVFLCGCCTCCYLAIIWGICCCLYVSNLYFVNLFTPEVCMCLLSHVRLFAPPWTAACQASLSFTISRRLLKLMSIESVMPSNLLVLSCPLLLPLSIFPRIRVFLN